MSQFENEARIYASDGRKKSLLGVRAYINGRLCLAYIKGNDVLSYIYYEDLCRKMLEEGPAGEIDPDTKTISWSSGKS